MRDIFLFAPVTRESAESVSRQIMYYDRQSNEEITIFINSPGGSITDMFAILNAMEVASSPIRTVVMGMAASASSVIAAAGKTRLITEDSEVMVHEASAFAIGNSSNLQETADRVNAVESRMFAKLAKYTNRPLDIVKSEFKGKSDKYFSAQEAVVYGLCDRIIKQDEARVLKLSESINVEGQEIKYQENGLSEVQILKEGRFEHEDYGVLELTAEVLEKMKVNFDAKVRGIDISLDYTHDNEGGQSPAACWIKELEVRGESGKKELFAKVEFTPKGKSLVLAKEYKYASADFSIDYRAEDGKHFPYVLRGGTLTNRPFIKGMKPIKLSENKQRKKEIINMDKIALINALRDEGIDVSALQAEVTTLKARVTELSVVPGQKDAEINGLKTKVTELEGKIALDEKTSVFNSLVSEGKVVPAQKDAVLAQFKTAAELSAFYKEAPAVIKTIPTGTEGQGTDDTLNAEEQSVVASGKYTKEEIIKNRKLGAKK